MSDLVFKIVISILLIVLVFTATALIYSALESYERKEVLMQQCLSDGRKEYECESILRGSSSSHVPIPIVVPIR